MNGKIQDEIYLECEDAFLSGVTDFFVLRRDEEITRALRSLKKEHPGVHIFMPDRINNGTFYLSEKIFSKNCATFLLP